MLIKFSIQFLLESFYAMALKKVGCQLRIVSNSNVTAHIIRLKKT